MKYLIQISRTWESVNGFDLDTREFEISADCKKEAMKKAIKLAESLGDKWSVSAIEEL
jgi:hypothetical protein